MKLILYLLISGQLLGSNFKLIFTDGKLVATEFTNQCLQLFASVDFRNWSLVKEFTNSTPAPAGHFYRARVKPQSPSIVPNTSRYAGTLVRFSGFSTAPLQALWLTNGTQVIEGFMERQDAIKGGCQWKFIPFNVSTGLTVLACRFEDTAGNVVLTNFTIEALGNDPAMTVTWPTDGAEVIGDEVFVLGKVDRLDAQVLIDTGSAIFPAVVRYDGTFLSRIPVAAENRITITSGFAEVCVGFRRSQLPIRVSVTDLRQVYGERGIVVQGTVDARYDVTVCGKRVVSTNGTWRTRITAQESGVLYYGVVPKSGVASVGTCGGAVVLPDEASYYACSFLESYGYYVGTNVTKSSKTSYRGWDQTNIYFVERRTIGKDPCSAQYEGMGEDLHLKEMDRDCDAVSYRPTFPRFLVSNYSEETSTDKIGSYSRSSCQLNIGGSPLDPRKYRVTVDLEVDEMRQRFEDEVCFERTELQPGWKVGGRSIPWTFIAYSGFVVDVTPEMPALNDAKWCQYRITMDKEAVP